MATKVRKHAQEKKLIGSESEWIGDSQLRLRAHEIVGSDKIIVDVMEISHHRMVRKGVDLRLARQFARMFGVVNVDTVKLSDFRTDKIINDINGKKKPVKIRHTFYVFRTVQ